MSPVNDRYHSTVQHPGLASLRTAVEPLRKHVLQHGVYHHLDTLAQVRTFQENHVFAVWDFMSLLKSLQLKLTCVGLPWVPNGPTASRRLINEIVLVEESDEFGDGYTSHFELYIQGMERSGASTSAVRAFVARLREGTPVAKAARVAEIPQPAANFITMTWRIIEDAPLHCQAAAFAFGREDLIPEMFEQVARIPDMENRLTLFKDYLVRHISVDGEQHTPMAMQMLVELCGDDSTRWAACTDTVRAALRGRLALWDAILLSCR